MTDSPLAEVSLVELFSVSPETLQPWQFDQIIQAFRSERLAWNKEEAIKAMKPKRGEAKGPKVDISLADLGL